MGRLGDGNLPLTGTTVQSKEMKKGTAEEFLSKLPTEAVSGLIFVSVLQSLDSQNWLTQHMRYASASPGYFGFLEPAQRSVLTKILQMCQIFLFRVRSRGPSNRECCPASSGPLRCRLGCVLGLPGRGHLSDEHPTCPVWLEQGKGESPEQADLSSLVLLSQAFNKHE